ncbi:glycosyltransferase [Kineosporia sp. J2-2]|uniref:Glycosyltransferase n=1 Tax=Kineosporia corallincola TaxID=2835133 RepID=A0ABS5TSF1_9ACTN|nr:glycosyltransferase [Kineosporia corallincola]MBT0773717.1 glycosyltransferase [Kineosporia corallincola]
MKVLLVGPDHPGGSLPPYLDVLATHLRRLGAHVDRLGSAGVPYDQDRDEFLPIQRILVAAQDLAAQADPGAYDLLSLHFGNLELEQLLPTIWQPRFGTVGPPAVAHVHALEPTLFRRHRPNTQLTNAVDKTLTGSARVFFGDYGRRILEARLPNTAGQLSRTIALPTTIPEDVRPSTSPRLNAVLRDPRPGTTVLTLSGYAAPWKDVPGLVQALKLTRSRLRVVLAGPFWDDPAQAGADLRSAVGRAVRLGRAAEFVVLPEYLDGSARATLVAGSHAGLFPYQPDATFQGSGAIADYLVAGRPVIATDVANMSELIQAAGTVVAPGEPKILAAALDRLALDSNYRSRVTDAARARSSQFTAASHAAQCLSFYREIVGRTPCRTEN